MKVLVLGGTRFVGRRVVERLHGRGDEVLVGLTAAPAQHVLVAVRRAEELLGWSPADPATRVAESVRWHLDHPPPGPTWSEADTGTDDQALSHARDPIP